MPEPLFTPAVRPSARRRALHVATPNADGSVRLYVAGIAIGGGQTVFPGDVVWDQDLVGLGVMGRVVMDWSAPGWWDGKQVVCDDEYSPQWPERLWPSHRQAVRALLDRLEAEAQDMADELSGRMEFIRELRGCPCLAGVPAPKRRQRRKPAPIGGHDA